MTDKYDSRPDTYEHIRQVQLCLNRIIRGLIKRGEVHDQTKLASPEKEYFDEHTPRLATLSYGTPEYKASLAAIKPALDHHYAHNSHHPEHYPNSIKGMNLLDLVEMICDWKASTMRHNDGNLRFSIENNQTRFGYSEDLKCILLNTIDLLEDD